jgi:hypothetical protein
MRQYNEAPGRAAILRTFCFYLRFKSMEIARKVKTGLDESRMLVLGTQVLIGFQFRSAFQNAFENLPPWSRHLDGVALLMLVCALGLLIFPGPYHRVVEEGKNSGRLCALIQAAASWALAPFAVGIGVGIGITCERIWGLVGGLAAGAGACLVACGLWYGLGAYRKASEGNAERAMTSQNPEKIEDPGLHEKIDAMLTEARVILPGAQALLGFQLAIVLTDGFEKLATQLKSLHGTALLLVCLSMLLLMAPAAYHRIVYAGEDSSDFHKFGSWLVTISTVPLALGISVDVLVVGTKMWSSTAAAILSALFSLLFLVLAWHIVPLVARVSKRQNRQPAPRRSSRLGWR